jgi:hypothetical protein
LIYLIKAFELTDKDDELEEEELEEEIIEENDLCEGT